MAARVSTSVCSARRVAGEGAQASSGGKSKGRKGGTYEVRDDDQLDDTWVHGAGVRAGACPGGDKLFRGRRVRGLAGKLDVCGGPRDGWWEARELE